MFLGHFALGLAAKPVARTVSLGTLFIATQFIDLLWPILLLFGVERVSVVPGITAMVPMDFEHYPWSHSLAMVIVWGLLIGLVYYLVKRNVKPSLVLGALVVSHWFLDLLVHRPDLPLYPGGERVGFGLWNHVTLEHLFEFGLFAVGAYLYSRVTKARNRQGSFGLIGLTLFLLLIHIGNIFGPPPPNDPVVLGWVGMAQWLFVFMAYWVDRNRVMTGGKN